MCTNHSDAIPQNLSTRQPQLSVTQQGSKGNILMYFPWALLSNGQLGTVILVTKFWFIPPYSATRDYRSLDDLDNFYIETPLKSKDNKASHRDNYQFIHSNDSVAQWIRRWSTKPEILGSIPSGVDFLLPFSASRCLSATGFTG